MQPSRRVALASATAAALGALTACTPIAQPWQTSSPSARAGDPSSRGKRRGINISPRRADYTAGYSSPWTGLWLDWDWTGKIRRDIDLGAGLGASLVRIVGAPQAVLEGLLPRDIYLRRLEQLLDHCDRRGMLLYPCGGTLRGWSTGAFPAAQVQDLLVEQASVLHQRRSQVFGFDLVNELAYSYRSFDPVTLRATVAGWARAIKSIAPDLRLTVSTVTRNPEQGHWASPELDSELDFYDFHLISAMPAAVMQEWRAHKPVVIGEIDVRRTASDRRERFAAIVREATAGGAAAMLSWDIASNDFGLYDAAGHDLDPALAAGFASIPDIR